MSNEIEMHDVEVEQTILPEIDKDTVLYPGQYFVEVPQGQKAIVRYEATTDDESSELDD